MHLPPKFSVQGSGINPSQAATFSDRKVATPGHVIHVTENPSARRSGQFDGSGVEPAQAARAEPLAPKFIAYALHRPETKWHEVAFQDIHDQDREECRGVREKHTLSSVDPYQVGVPVILGRLE